MKKEFLEMIGMVEAGVRGHLPSLMLCRWAEVRAEADQMTVREYWDFKTKLGMGF